MIEVTAIIGEKSNPKKNWKEQLEVSSIENAEKEVKEIVNSFNDSLRAGETPRIFIRLLKNKNALLHNWEKLSLMSLTDKDGSGINIYQCKNCKLVTKTQALTHPSDMGGQRCFPELVCRKCNKQFKTKKGRKEHKCKANGVYSEEVLGKKLSEMALLRLKGTDFDE